MKPSHEKSGHALRRDALAIFHAGVNAVEPESAVEKFCRMKNDILSIHEKPYDLTGFEHVWVVGAGKAAAPMAMAMEKIIGPHLTGGMITVKYHHTRALEKIKVVEAGHPLPDESGIRGATAMARLAASAGKNDLVICLISGGGSALLPLPAKGISLSNKQDCIQALLACGASIDEINTIRKHLSAIKGGRLAEQVHPATLITLILSDVVGDDPAVIASGPTVPDTTTFAESLGIIKKYGLATKLPPPVMAHMKKGLAGMVPETPKPHAPFFEKTQNIIIGNNFLALRGAAQKAKSLGYHTLILSSQLEGDTTESAKFHCAVAKEILKTGHPVASPACILSGGETTVILKGKGLGGRNQEFALVSATAIHGLKPIVVFSAGTDGTDGPTDAAGAIADNNTLSRAFGLGLDPHAYLERNDSHAFFQCLNDLIITGPTCTNVMDLHILLVA